MPAVLATGGDARSYLAAAGVMARLGTVLGWRHYASGWHATCTAGAPAAAVAAGLSHGLAPVQLAQGKFSLEYAIAAAVLDGFPGLASFTDESVRRAPAQSLLDRVEAEASDGGDGLLAGELTLTVHLDDGQSRTATVRQPPGSRTGRRPWRRFRRSSPVVAPTCPT